MRKIWRSLGGRGAVAGLLLAMLGGLAAVGWSGGGAQTAVAAPSDPANLSLTKSDSPDPVATGATLTYTIGVHNAGPDPATNTVVTDGLPGGVDFVSATPSAGTCDRNGSKVVCELGTVTTATDATITIAVTVKKKSGQITNSASVTSAVADPNPGNNLDSEVTTIAKPPAPLTCSGEPVTILGTPGPDTLAGTAGADVVSAREGDDVIFGFRGGDVICAGPGSDMVRTGKGNDSVFAASGSDFVWGRRGDDVLLGLRGRDRLRGGDGDDLVAGGRGFDRCRGGRGLDRLRGCER